MMTQRQSIEATTPEADGNHPFAKAISQAEAHEMIWSLVGGQAAFAALQ
jgi:hypothetical protein